MLPSISSSIHSVRTNTAASDSSYNCVTRLEDSQGLLGVTTTKDLIQEAIRTLEANLTTLGHLVLPISEKIRLVTNYTARRFHGAKVKPYVPNFMKSIDHVITHVGAKHVLDGVERKLKLSKTDMEASRMTLYRFGNTASSSVWYGLAYAEAKGRIKRGDRVWQISFGSGFKCTSLIMKAMRAVDREEKNPWSSEIDEFPVESPERGPERARGPFHMHLSRPKRYDYDDCGPYQSPLMFASLLCAPLSSLLAENKKPGLLMDTGHWSLKWSRLFSKLLLV
ncbi:3-KETOACYL-COA SYNTHASE 2-LIKE [Salix koriyanagi]|uniref:very-long-chain 3-oxoacyl-CoA synthase n=1 Tax=Salix koriyanagi TaxID=2511006 RepID=A0A9Q0QMB4_9ROSI|nr:3-KETOACYL-COA SYNTHASE 2-LIKE [Salix koriyanagi]